MNGLPKHKAKKSLGQNFLNSDHIAGQIIDSVSLSKDSIVLEVGPGKGMLTEKLLSTGATVFAIEKDYSLLPILKERFATAITSDQLILIHEDILESDIAKYLKEGEYKLIANIPYYITGLLFRKFLEGAPQPSEIVVMVQKEVAQRILARNGRESILSISVKTYGTPSIVATVSAGSFTPAPTVDSAILKITNISREFFTNEKLKTNEQAFFKLLRAGFAHKRKHLLSNFLTAGIKTRRELEAIFQNLHISLITRPESITTKEWGALAEALL
jgi:16S rRNA (adenine1518-N6/adenine1519-N6)-dimethyltransferase